MKTRQLLDDLEFHDPVPFAQPILVDQSTRILRWMLQPGQQVAGHRVPDSPLYIVILKGKGAFAGPDGVEQECGPHSLLIFEQDELHSLRALDEELVFVSFMQGVDTMRPERTGGEIGRE